MKHYLTLSKTLAGTPSTSYPPQPASSRHGFGTVPQTPFFTPMGSGTPWGQSAQPHRQHPHSGGSPPATPGLRYTVPPWAQPPSGVQWDAAAAAAFGTPFPTAARAAAAAERGGREPPGNSGGDVERELLSLRVARGEYERAMLTQVILFMGRRAVNSLDYEHCMIAGVSGTA